MLPSSDAARIREGQIRAIERGPEREQEMDDRSVREVRLALASFQHDHPQWAQDMPRPFDLSQPKTGGEGLQVYLMLLVPGALAHGVGALLYDRCYRPIGWMSADDAKGAFRRMRDHRVSTWDEYPAPGYTTIEGYGVWLETRSASR